MDKDKAEARIVYTGSALQDGAMEVRSFAPAVLAFSEACVQAHEVLTGQEKGVYVYVRSDFKPGSFDFGLVVEVGRQFLPLFSATPLNAVQFLAMLGVVKSDSMGLLAMIKALRGRQPQPITQKGDGNVIIQGDLVVKDSVIKVYNDPHVRRGLMNAVKPLEGHGINGMQFRDAQNGRDIVEEITRQDVPFFKVPGRDGAMESVTDVLLQPITVQLTGDRQWGFLRGGEQDTVRARVSDEEFTNKVAKGQIRFAHGDTLRVQLRTTQWTEGAEVKAKYEVIKVLNYYPGPGDRRLDLVSL